MGDVKGNNVKKNYFGTRKIDKEEWFVDLQKA
jgi:hypothetical protein